MQMMRVTEKKQSDKQSNVVTQKINILRKSLSRTEHVNLLPTPKKRQKLSSFPKVKFIFFIFPKLLTLT